MLGAGPGALLDLPDVSVLIAGLDHWGNPLKPGARLRASWRCPTRACRSTCGAASTRPRPCGSFMSTPRRPRRGRARAGGLRAWEFPEWFVTRDFGGPGAVRPRRALALSRAREALNSKGQLDVDDDPRPEHKKRSRSVPVVPVRFVRACPKATSRTSTGGLRPPQPSSAAASPSALRLEERGTSGDIAELFVVCTVCKTEQSMVRATEFDRATGLGALGRCRGASSGAAAARPPSARTRGQPSPSKLLIRSATNAWFPAQLSAITLPTAEATKSEALRRILDASGTRASRASPTRCSWAS
jgi:hypothetical protein